MPLINQYIPRLKKLAFSINIPMPSVPQFKSYAQQNFPKYLDPKLYRTSYHDIDETEDNHLTHITKNANEDRYFAIQGNFAYDYIEKNQFYLIEFYQFNKKNINYERHIHCCSSYLLLYFIQVYGTIYRSL